MAEIKNAAYLLILLILISPVYSLDFDVEIVPEVDHDTVDVNIKQNFTHVFEANASVQNTGSFECRYRLRADINETVSNESYRAYSRSRPLPPGVEERVKIYASPYNYTGPIEGNLYIEFCGKEELIQDFNSTSTQRTTTDNKISLQEIEINKTRTNTTVNLTEALLVPKDYPAFWKVGHSNVKNGTTLLDYEMPFTNYGRNITYTAFNSTTNQPLGTVKADLQIEEDDDQKQLLQKIIDNKYKIGLGASVILNLSLLILFLRLKGLKLKF